MSVLNRIEDYVDTILTGIILLVSFINFDTQQVPRDAISPRLAIAWSPLGRTDETTNRTKKISWEEKIASHESQFADKRAFFNSTPESHRHCPIAVCGGFLGPPFPLLVDDI